ncbi:MAG: hypothetical protein R3F37_06670 [Candidatus Competibacteraceae bacterium]
MAQVTAEHEELHNNFSREQLQRQIEHQAAAKTHDEFEATLEQLTTEKIIWKKTHNEQTTHWNQEREMRVQELKQLRVQLEKLQQEKTALENTLNQQTARWQRERQNLDKDIAHLQTWCDRLQQEKSSTEGRLDKERNDWEQARLDLDIQLAEAQTAQQRLESKLAAGMLGSEYNTWKNELEDAALSSAKPKRIKGFRR